MITVTAQGGVQPPGIGSGSGGRCGAVIISGTASGSADGGEDSSKDIGPGSGGNNGRVTVLSNFFSGSY